MDSGRRRSRSRQCGRLVGFAALALLVVYVGWFWGRMKVETLAEVEDVPQFDFPPGSELESLYARVGRFGWGAQIAGRIALSETAARELVQELEAEPAFGRAEYPFSAVDYSFDDPSGDTATTAGRSTTDRETLRDIRRVWQTAPEVTWWQEFGESYDLPRQILGGRDYVLAIGILRDADRRWQAIVYALVWPK